MKDHCQEHHRYEPECLECLDAKSASEESELASAAAEKCIWQIEYEISPRGAIYFAEAGPCTEAEAREKIRTAAPLWRIRKLVRRNF